MNNKNVPLGIRNCNPGNLRANPYNPHFWKKQVGFNKGFCVFENMYFGVRALCRLLLTYYKRGWLKSPSVFVSHYAPVSDNNDEISYFAYVQSSWMHGVFSPHHLAVSVMEMEVGCDFVTDEMIVFARQWCLHFFSEYFNIVPNNPDLPVCVKESAY